MKLWCLEVWGDYACFTRPELKVERVSYDVMTPASARAIFEAILWKPAIQWEVVKIEVLHPIQWASVRRNEVGKTASKPTAAQMSGVSGAPMGIYAEEARQQRAGLLLKDVRYRIYGRFEFIPPEKRLKSADISTAHMDTGEVAGIWADHEEGETQIRLDESEAKYAAMFQRRATKGQCFHRPYLGCREFACYFRLVDAPELEPVQPLPLTRDLGYMLYDMDYAQNTESPEPMFFRGNLVDGVLCTDRRVVEVVK